MAEPQRPIPTVETKRFELQVEKYLNEKIKNELNSLLPLMADLEGCCLAGDSESAVMILKEIDHGREKLQKLHLQRKCEHNWKDRLETLFVLFAHCEKCGLKIRVTEKSVSEPLGR